MRENLDSKVVNLIITPLWNFKTEYTMYILYENVYTFDLD